jgi:hypothetical protein
METIARIFGITSREALIDFARAVDEWATQDKLEFFRLFGPSVERWYFQEIDGKPYVIAIARADNAAAGYQHLATSADPFTRWFREQVQELTGVDLTTMARGPASEFIYEFRV